MMKIMPLTMGGIAMFMLAASVPATAQTQEPTTGLPYCNAKTTDNCIQRIDIKRHGGVKQPEADPTAPASTAQSPDAMQQDMPQEPTPPPPGGVMAPPDTPPPPPGPLNPTDSGPMQPEGM